jgi:hypothetical protein
MQPTPSTNGKHTNGKLTAEHFLTGRKSQGYKVAGVFGGGYAARTIDDRPLFTWMQADRMRRDPQVDFGLRIIRSPIYGATWDVKCRSTRVAEFVHQTLMRFWQRGLRKTFRFFEYGVSVGEISHKLESGLVQFDRLDDFHPRDSRPLEFLEGRRRGELAGIKLNNIAGDGQGQANILAPHCWWFPGEAEYGSLYGRPRLAGAYEPWLEKRGRNGATDSRRLWYKKCAFRGGVMRHPPGMTDMGDESASVLRSNQDIAREICEKFENGGILALLNTTDEHGNPLWAYEPPASHPDVAGLREYPKDLDREILIGLGVPPELVEAATVGSGYSGRAIPAQVFFTSIDEIIALILDVVDRLIVRPLVRLNFGNVPYHILPRSLAALVAKEPGGSGQPKGGDGADAMGKQQDSGGGGSGETNIELSDALKDRVKRLAESEYPDLESVRLSGNFDESQHARDHGKFASKPGASGDSDASGKPTTAPPPDKPRGGKLRSLLALRHLVPPVVRRKVTAFVAKTYTKLEAKYGATGAKLVLGGMVALLPLPIPGSSVIPIAIAEGVKRVRKLFSGRSQQAAVAMSDAILEAMDAETLAAMIRETLAAIYADAGETAQAVDDAKVREVAEKLIGDGEAVELSDAKQGDDADIRRAIYDAMLQASARVQSGDDAAQDELDALADLAVDHSDFAKSINLSWVEHGTSRTGKPRWKNTETGSIRYQESKPGEKREKRQANEKRARELADEIQSHLLHPEEFPPPTPEQWQELADNLPGLSVDALKSVRNRLLLSAPDAKRHGQLVEAIKSHIAGGPKPLKKPADKPDGKPVESAPKNPVPGKVYNVTLSDLHVDPDRFQFKLNVKGPAGVGEELKGVSKFNPDFAGVISVWKDPADGKTYVINGHHRHELASRTGHGSLAVRYIDAPSAVHARGKGALINIAEGRGTAVDAAKFMRDTGTTPDDFKDQGISLKGNVARDAAVLMNLSDPLFSRVSRGTLEIDRALAIAGHLPDKDRQTELLGHIEREEERTGKEYSPRIVAEAAQEMASTPTVQEAEQTLFGEEVNEKSLFMQRSELKSHVRGELSKELRDFQAVASQRRADAVSGDGNTLNVEGNREKAKLAENRVDTFSRLASYKGELSDLLNEQAEKYARAKNNKDRDAVRRETVDRIRTALSEIEQRGIPAMGVGGEDAPRTQ